MGNIQSMFDYTEAKIVLRFDIRKHIQGICSPSFVIQSLTLWWNKTRQRPANFPSMEGIRTRKDRICKGEV